ncbi:hypothetical protein EMCG_06618 [[Emmonsia] crescens]|uniref:Uncharacterized protein n=1 Tax=[Emmonsia] crescens TaxID=73230 RepID=A0A0G2JBM7_9EURO|nr:hypothetical protein EMCG_06618 [Emmonsia crescens UAMH 3008]
MLEYSYGTECHATLSLFFNNTDALILTFDVTMREELDLIVQTHADFLRFLRNGSTPQSCLFAVNRFHNHLSSLRTSQTFTCFPRLPQELQLAVLRAALTSPDPVALDTPHVSGINLNILKVCKLFHEEGTKIFWKENTFMTMKLIIVVADTSWVTPNKPRAVTTEEGQEFARRLGCNYVELSSKVNEPVMGVMSDLVREHKNWTLAAAINSGSAPQVQSTNPIAQGMKRWANRRSPKEVIRSLAGSFKRRASRIFT